MLALSAKRWTAAHSTSEGRFLSLPFFGRGIEFLVQLSAHATDKPTNKARHDKSGQEEGDPAGKGRPIPRLYFRASALIDQAINDGGKGTCGEKRGSSAITRDKGAE